MFYDKQIAYLNKEINGDKKMKLFTIYLSHLFSFRQDDLMK